MSIKIHHGGNGAYKTSGALQDDVIPELKKGRVVVTNIRGLSLERVYQVYPDLPDTADVINIDSDTTEGMEKVRTWFRWVPEGALIVFDETQNIFPKSWRDRDLERFKFPGTREDAKAANQPFDWLDAWTRHRHFEWDIVLTTPDIKYVRDDIRNTSEQAYYHANLALVGVKGRYREVAHNPVSNTPPAGSPAFTKKIKQKTFECYESTTTGAVRDTRAGFNAFLSGRLFFALAFAVIGIAFALSSGGSGIITGDGHQAGTASTQAAQQTVNQGDSQAVATSVVVASPKQTVGGRADSRVRGGLLKGFRIYIDLAITVNYQHEYYFSVSRPNEAGFRLSHREIELAGYEVIPKSSCLVLLVSADELQPVTCSRSWPSEEIREPSKDVASL